MRGRGSFLVAALLVFAIFASIAYSAKPRIVVLANDIDFGLASEFFGFLENRGMETIRATPEDFEKHKSERFIVILGGPDAYDGVGDIVGEILSGDEKAAIREMGNRKSYVKINPWGSTPGQRVTILAGSDRDQTKRAHEENRNTLVSEIEDEGSSGEVRIEIKGFAFSPSTATVSAGTTVVWTNMDGAPHTASSLDGIWDSGTLGKDGSYSYSYEELGTYNYQCNIHPSMKGKVVVE